MAIKDHPGFTTMPKTKRDWTKFIQELSDAIEGIETDVPPSGNFMTLDTTQTASGLKTFTANPLFTSFPLWNNDNVGTQISSLPLDATPDPNLDYLAMYDSSGDKGVKIVLSDLITQAVEVNDLSDVVTWAIVPDAFISEGSITQHEAALTIVEGQITGAAFTNWNTAFGWGDHAGLYSLTSHTHTLSTGATDVTSTAAELNLLDLAGLTAGWVLSADTATTASWKAQALVEVNDLTASVTWANVPDVNITESSVTQHEAALSITQSQVSDVTALPAELNLLDLAGLTTGWVLSADSATTASWKDAGIVAEVNDLTAAVTWANVPDANITQSSVLQHEGALSIAESQITDGTLLARLADTETITGDWTFKKNSNASMTVTIGESTTLRGTAQDGNLEIYGEQASLISGVQLNVGTNTLNFKAPSAGSPVANVWYNDLNVEIRDGSYLRFRDSLNTSSATYASGASTHSVTGAGSYRFTSWSEVWMRDGVTLRISDSGDSDHAEFSHDGTDFLTDFTNTTDWNITGITSLEAPAFNGVALTTAGAATNYLDETGAYSVPPGSGGGGGADDELLHFWFA
jgi:hypothetical protein